MHIHSILVVIAFLPLLAFSANSIRCQCTKAYSGIPCYNSWCEIRSNATHIGACAIAKKSGSTIQTLACALVTERADQGKCAFDGKRNFTKCWCTRGDYCNVDLVDRIRDKRDDEEDEYDDFTVETDTEFNENTNDIGSDEDVEDSQEFRAGSPSALVPERIDAVDMRKPVERKQPDPDEQALPPWRRMNPLNADSGWKPPPPPPMPGKHPIIPPTTTTSTTTTTTTTTTTAPPTRTTTSLTYEERMRQYEERRRQIEMQREAELKRRAEVERQRMEEKRLLESQHEQKRRFGEKTRSWPVAPVAQEAPTTTTTTTPTTTTLASTTTTTTTTTTTAPPTTTTRATTTTTRPAAKEEKSYESYYRNWKPHRRPLDLNPTQSVSIQSVSAIVYPPKNFVKATKSTPTTTLPTTTTTQETTTTTQPIIYPPANFRKATKGTSTTTTTTTKAPRTTTTEKAYTLPTIDDEEDYDDEDDELPYETDRKMVEMPKIESDEVDSVVMYTPRPPQNRPPPPSPTPSVRTPAEKMDEYKKLLAAQEPSSSALSIILPSFISIIILFLL